MNIVATIVTEGLSERWQRSRHKLSMHNEYCHQEMSNYRLSELLARELSQNEKTKGRFVQDPESKYTIESFFLVIDFSAALVSLALTKPASLAS